MKKITAFSILTILFYIFTSCTGPSVNGNASVVVEFPSDTSLHIQDMAEDVIQAGELTCTVRTLGAYKKSNSKRYISLSDINNDTITLSGLSFTNNLDVIVEISCKNTIWYYGRLSNLTIRGGEITVNIDLKKNDGSYVPDYGDDAGPSYVPPAADAGFVLVNANGNATFKMGREGAASGQYGESPVHNVKLTRRYYVCDHEVTQKEYGDVMGILYSDEVKDVPVEITYQKAMEYCNRRSSSEGLNSCYSVNGSADASTWPTNVLTGTIVCDMDSNGYRLPTEAEWEYMARGGSDIVTAKIYGGTLDETQIGDYAWYSVNSEDKLHDVKQKNPNGYGLYDVCGNAAEWCWGVQTEYSSEDVTDPVTQSGDGYISYRGGSYKSNELCVTQRAGVAAGGIGTQSNGLRVVRSLVPDLKKIEITSLPSKTVYLLNESFDKTGMIVKAYSADGTIEDVTSKVTYSGFSSTALNDSLPVTVSYTKNGITKTATLALSIVETMGTGNFVYTSAKVGDIILADGSIASYTEFDRTTMKAAAVIFREASDTQPALGVGLVESPVSARWSVSGSEAYKTTVSYMKNDSLTDGSKGWNLMLSATNNDLTANPDYYSAWYFCKNYGTNNGLLTLNNKWYFPTVSEMKEFKNTFATVNSSLTKVGGTVLKNAYYKTCNQNSTQGYIDTINPSTGATSSCQKTDVSNYTVRAIRAFGKPKQWSVNSLSLQSKLVINGIEVAYTGEAAVLTETKLIPNTTYGTMFKTGRNITLSPYIIGKYEVTQKLFSTVMGYNPSLCNSSNSSYKPDSNSDIPNLPVDNVNWYEACAFCNELTKSLFGTATDQFVYYSDRAFSTVYTVDDALNQVNAYMKPGAKGYRLPTGAEWEYAARGGEYSTEEQYQYRYSGVDSNNTSSAWDSTLDRSVWYLFNLENGNTVSGAGTQLTSGYSGFSSKRVGRKSTNAAGIYDMSGNVNEWCYDKYQLTLENPVSITDPLGPDDDSITSHEYRGGSWGMYAKDMQLYNRSSSSAGAKSVSMGFRICRYAD
ncbi:MAG: SUMF1/EgtB/PvdO family nonheme iron enzyme [Treponema sp.]|uniref:SUMF1/EgtB/PvdO family nonheme iron enzyme n=1 Tax=Treponema sp. TaxID=166 RepID=UPI00298D81EB|nr:SUMF1/EgtB/PvdO family nonheme iron enzyme [Treponema sp.]MCQ2600311.1 SUMF1/EgtB/PvdO family nonheme iron enzyme [Treponema sp.]